MRRVRDAVSLGAKLVRVSRGLGIPIWRSTPRFIKLIGPRRFAPAEIWSLALLDPALGGRQLLNYVSKESAWPLYERGNRNEALALLNDKEAFDDTCRQIGLATLGCERVIDAQGLAELRRLAGADQPGALEAWLTNMPEHFVVKPIEGYHGDGVRFFRRVRGGLQLVAGPVIDFREFVSELEEIASASKLGSREEGANNRMMVQRMGFAHPAIAELSGSEVMQSVRICTYLDPQGAPELLFGFLKLIAGDALIDNFQGGKTGNLIADLDRDSGRVTRAIRFDTRLGGSRPVDRHPVTGRPLIGIEVPHWQAACELALRAAKGFHRTRAVGWDIGITETGPVLMEGNGTWDPVSPWYRPLPVEPDS